MKKARLLRDCYRTKPTPPDTIKNRARNPAEVLTETKPGREATKLRIMTPNVSNINGVKNQFLIVTQEKEVFKSYDSIIAVRTRETGQIVLDQKYWNYSATTNKYRNIFLGETKKDTEQKIASGEYKLTNLNK
jgi:hypothetical protein|tara:strand:+ start:1163 stop:1561 length:399 start_codon:yes stop_codon:yes gene_type:complete